MSVSTVSLLERRLVLLAHIVAKRKVTNYAQSISFGSRLSEFNDALNFDITIE